MYLLLITHRATDHGEQQRKRGLFSRKVLRVESARLFYTGVVFRTRERFAAEQLLYTKQSCVYYSIHTSAVSSV